MIVEQGDLDEALDHMGAPHRGRRHPYDKGLRQRCRDAAARVRRLARALDGGGVLVLLLVLAALAACSVPQPLNAEVAAPAGADDAAAIVVQEWSERLPHAARLSVGDLPTVRWFAGDHLDYGGGDAGDKVNGDFKWTPFDAEIHLLVRDTIADSALAHEVLHWALDELGGDPDGDHRGAAWAELGDVRADLLKAGL
jgi:hypothetical protein